MTTPNDVAIDIGSLSGGAASSLSKDDGSFLQVSSSASGTRTTEWYGVFPAVPNDLVSLKVTFRGKTSAGCSHNLSIWDWSTSGWSSYDSRSLGTKEIGVTKSLSGPLGDYVDGTGGTGEVRVRARCTRSSSSFVTRTDLLRLSYGY